MKALFACLAMLGVSASDPPLPPNAPPGATYVSSSWPPQRFQGDNVAVVIFTSHVDQFCGKAQPPYTILACETTQNGAPVIVLPNPNMAPQDDPYARLTAHELGHLNGWPAWHGQ
jgi:hypothetical protein